MSLALHQHLRAILNARRGQRVVCQTDASSGNRSQHRWIFVELSISILAVYFRGDRFISQRRKNRGFAEIAADPERFA